MVPVIERGPEGGARRDDTEGQTEEEEANKGPYECVHEVQNVNSRRSIWPSTTLIASYELWIWSVLRSLRKSTQYRTEPNPKYFQGDLESCANLRGR